MIIIFDLTPLLDKILYQNETYYIKLPDRYIP